MQHNKRTAETSRQFSQNAHTFLLKQFTDLSIWNNEIRHIFRKHTLGKIHPYLCCIPNVQPVSLTGGHGGSGVNLQSVVWSSLIFTLMDTKAKLRVCLCVCCEWNAAYINRLNLTCQTLQTTLKHHGGTDSHQRGRQRKRGGGGLEEERGRMTPRAEWCCLAWALPSGDVSSSFVVSL